jgi:putative exosortase-associated protein (TIGR04073 family)
MKKITKKLLMGAVSTFLVLGSVGVKADAFTAVTPTYDKHAATYDARATDFDMKTPVINEEPTVNPVATMSDDNFVRKLARGVANVGFGVLEIPMKIHDVNQENGGIASVTYGTFLGITHFVARELVGVFEVVTFPIPMPGGDVESDGNGWGYGPIITPEFVVDREHNMFNIVYQDGTSVFGD